MAGLHTFLVDAVSFGQFANGEDNRVVSDGTIAVEAGQFVYLECQDSHQKILVQVISDPCNFIGEAYMFWIERLINNGVQVMSLSEYKAKSNVKTS